MNKREYAKANLDWLAAKAEEEGVIALPEGIYSSFGFRLQAV